VSAATASGVAVRFRVKGHALRSGVTVRVRVRIGSHGFTGAVATGMGIVTCQLGSGQSRNRPHLKYVPIHSMHILI